MSLQNPNPLKNNWLNPLIGACLGICVGLPIAAMIGGGLGETYEQRLVIYLSLLTWTIVGAVVLYFRTKNAPVRAFTFRYVVLWALMLWIWPLIFLVPKSKK